MNLTQNGEMVNLMFYTFYHIKKLKKKKQGKI